MTKTLELAELKRKPMDAYHRFEVAFQAFNRTFETIEDARSYCRRCDFDTNEIVPVVIGYEQPRKADAWLGRASGHQYDYTEAYHIFEPGEQE